MSWSLKTNWIIVSDDSQYCRNIYYPNLWFVNVIITTFFVFFGDCETCRLGWSNRNSRPNYYIAMLVTSVGCWNKRSSTIFCRIQWSLCISTSIQGYHNFWIPVTKCISMTDVSDKKSLMTKPWCWWPLVPTSDRCHQHRDVVIRPAISAVKTILFLVFGLPGYRMNYSR